MARAVPLDDLTDRVTGAAVTSPRYPSRGHMHWSATVKFKNAGAGPARVFTLKGTNDPADTTGATILTINGAGNGSVSGDATAKAYRYVFWTLDAGTNLDIDEVHVWGTGFAGTE